MGTLPFRRLYACARRRVLELGDLQFEHIRMRALLLALLRNRHTQGAA